MGILDLKQIAEELTSRIRSSVSVEWHRRESARAKIRIEVKNVRREWGHLPDFREDATELAPEQAVRLCDEWVGR